MNDNQENQIYSEAPEEVRPMKFFERIGCLFISPAKLMENIREQPKLGAPILILFLISIGFGFLASKLAVISLRDQSIILAERYGTDFLNLTQSTAIMEGNPLFTIGISIVSTFISVLISAVISSVFLLLFTKILKGSAKFGQYYAMYLHTAIVAWLGAIVSACLSILLDSSMSFISLAPVFMPNGNFTMPLFNLFSSITLFGIWESILIFIGIREINEFSSAKAASLTIILFLLGVLVATGMLSATVIQYDFLSKTLGM